METGARQMNIENLTKLIDELAEVIRFHELATVDSKAAELLEQIDEMKLNSKVDDEDITDFIEDMRVANLVNTTR